MPQVLDFRHLFISKREEVVLEVHYFGVFSLDVIVKFVEYLQQIAEIVDLCLHLR